MFKYIFFLALYSALVYQASASAKSDAKKLFLELMEVIDKALTLAENTLNKAMDQVKAEAIELENKAIEEFDKTLVPLKKKLDDLIAEAKAKVIDIVHCQIYIGKFYKTSDDLVHNLVDCFNPQISKAQVYVDDALNTAKKIKEDMIIIDQDIDNCYGTFLEKEKCFLTIIDDIAKYIIEAPQHIMEDVTKATALVTGIVSIMEECSINQLKHAGEDAAKDVDDFVICVAIPI